MKLAVFSDVHANPDALQMVLNDAKEHSCERFVCLGDIVGYGYDPNACIDICRKENIECILGNHDVGVVRKLGLRWFSEVAKSGILKHSKEVDKPRKDWLLSLEYQKREVIGTLRCCFSHGSFSQPEEFEYIEDLWAAKFEFEIIKGERENPTHLGLG